MAKEIIWNNSKGQYELAQFVSVEHAKAYIDSIALTNVVIQSEEDYSAVRSCRTMLNKERDEIKDARKQATAVILSLFEPTLREIENYISAKSDELTLKLNAYKPRKEREKKSWKLEVSFDNPKALEKVKQYAIKYGGKIKEEKEKE